MKVKHITPEDNTKKGLTLIKVGNKDYWPSPKDLETLRDVVEGKLDPREINIFENVEINVEDIDLEAEHKLMLVRVGGENYQPTHDELEQWRKVFEEAQYDTDYKIFTHSQVSIDIIDLKNNEVVVI